MRAILCIVLSAFLPVVALGQALPNEELSQVKSETALLKAKADEAAALRAVRENLGVPASSAGPVDKSEGDLPAADPPTILGVFGPTGRTYAQLELANGQRVKVASGGVVPGGKWQVAIVGTTVRLIPIARRRSTR